MNELTDLHQSTKDHLEALIITQYSAECSAASSLANVVMGKISEGSSINGTLLFEVSSSFGCLQGV